MELFFIGGTGLIGSACSELAIARGHELYLLNRSASKKYPLPKGATLLKDDIHADETHPASLRADHRFGAVVPLIAAKGWTNRHDILFAKPGGTVEFIL